MTVIRRTKRGLLGLAALLALLSACGNEAQGSIDAAFRARANAVCADAIARHEGQQPFPLKDFDRLRPKAEELPTIGTYFGKYNDTHITAMELRALGEPQSGVEDWRMLLDLVERYSVNSRAQIDAANAKDVDGFVRAVKEGDVIFMRLGEVGPAAGFSGSAGCAKYYG